jgi:hypothetical protein
MTAQQLKTQLRTAHSALLEAMRTAVQGELAKTVQRWHDADNPRQVWARDRDDVVATGDWPYLGADFVYSGLPWQAAAAEPLYALAVDLANEADSHHEGLRLHKGIDYFMLGMARFLQGCYDEGAHNILIAVQEDRAAGSEDKDIVAAEQLDRRVIPWVQEQLAGAAQLCQNAGHAFVTPAQVGTMLGDMCRNQQDQTYRPTWLLWLHSSLRKARELPGQSPLTPVRRLEALQDLTFLFEAALRERLEQPGTPLRTLYNVMDNVRTSKGYPVAVSGRWSDFTNFDEADPNATPDAKLTALQAESFGGMSDPERLTCHALLTVGLVRNMVHHRLDLGSMALNAHYEWVRDRVLAALLLSW